MFPDYVTLKLKHGDNSMTEKHERVTVLFSDIVGYTTMSTSVSTADVFDIELRRKVWQGPEHP